MSRSSDRPRQTLGTTFDPRHNSLNLLRLVLALMVVFSHCGLGGFRDPLLMGHTTIGIVAVYGFFAISGYLIASSAERNGLFRFLWLRSIRIFPAFWACLVVTAFVFGLIAWNHQQAAAAHPCSFSCYLHAPMGPLGYIRHNFFLHINQPTIATTLNGNPWPYEWNVSIWTLFYEFSCYLILAALALLRLLRHRVVVLVLVACLWTVEILVGMTHPSLTPEQWAILTLVPVFLSGTLLYLFRDVIPDSRVLALILGLLYCASPWIPFGGPVLPFQSPITASQAAAPLLAYPVFWLGSHLPFTRVGARNDYSYGVYVYSSPIQQLLVVLGLQRFGFVAYLGLGLLITAPFAVASWWLIERRALRLRSLEIRRRQNKPSLGVPGVDAELGYHEQQTLGQTQLADEVTSIGGSVESRHEPGETTPMQPRS